MSAKATFSITDNAGDQLTVTDSHFPDSLAVVQINDGATVQLTHEELDKLSGVLREIHYRRDQLLTKPTVELDF